MAALASAYLLVIDRLVGHPPAVQIQVILVVVE
jgi:hypothetical protein